MNEPVSDPDAEFVTIAEATRRADKRVTMPNRPNPLNRVPGRRAHVAYLAVICTLTAALIAVMGQARHDRRDAERVQARDARRAAEMREMRRRQGESLEAWRDVLIQADVAAEALDPRPDRRDVSSPDGAVRSIAPTQIAEIARYTGVVLSGLTKKVGAAGVEQEAVVRATLGELREANDALGEQVYADGRYIKALERRLSRHDEGGPQACRRVGSPGTELEFAL